MDWTQQFCKHGAKVMIADVQDNQGRLICNDIGTTHASFVHCDVTKETDMVVADNGKIDIMVNNAGIMDTRKPSILDNEIAGFECVLGTKHAAWVMKCARLVLLSVCQIV